MNGENIERMKCTAFTTNLNEWVRRIRVERMEGELSPKGMGENFGFRWKEREKKERRRREEREREKIDQSIILGTSTQNL